MAHQRQKLRVPALLLQEPAIAQPVLRALTLGVADTYLASPVGLRDEGFHLGIAEPRSRTDPATRAYITRRPAEGKTLRETKRCLIGEVSAV